MTSYDFTSARNDLPTPQSVRVTIDLLHFATGESTPVSVLDMDLAAGAGTTVFFCADGAAVLPVVAPGVQAPARNSTETAVVVTAANATNSNSNCEPYSSILNASGKVMQIQSHERVSRISISLMQFPCIYTHRV